MKVLKTAIWIAVVAMVGSAPALAQTPPPQTPPAGQKPATPPAEQKPAPQPPRPFPEGAKIAYVNMQFVASSSAAGKAASAQIQEWDKKKTAELQAKNKQAQDVQNKLTQSGGVLSEQARTQTEKELQKLQRELQAMQEDAQQERNELQQRLLEDFSRKVNPILTQIASEKGLHMIFSATAESGIAWADAGLDLSGEVVKRLDAGAGTAPPKK